MTTAIPTLINGDETPEKNPKVVLNAIWCPFKSRGSGNESSQERQCVKKPAVLRMQSISKRFSVLKHTLKQTTRIKLHQAGQQNALLKAIKEQESRKVYRNVKQLMESTVVNVNLTDSAKKTPLMYAVQYHRGDNCARLLDLLVSNGAFLNAIDSNGQSVLHLAIELGNYTAASYLINTYKTLDLNLLNQRADSPLMMCAQIGDSTLALVKVLTMTQRLQINTSGAKNRTALHVAAQQGSLKIVKLLLENRANVNHKDSDGQTPLHLGASNFHSSIVQLLLDYGADTTITDASNMTAAQLASQKFYGPCMETMNCFVRQCANVDNHLKRPANGQDNIDNTGDADKEEPSAKRHKANENEEVEFELNTRDGSNSRLVSELGFSKMEPIYSTQRSYVSTPLFNRPTLVSCTRLNPLNGNKQQATFFYPRNAHFTPPIMDYSDHQSKYASRQPINANNVFYPQKSRYF